MAQRSMKSEMAVLMEKLSIYSLFMTLVAHCSENFCWT
jgi:hypothetical protein